MEDLLENFSKHVNKIISSKLGSKIRNLARAKTNYRTEEDFAKLEANIQMLIESYLSNLKDNDYKEIASNIFNSFIEEDDKNLIKAINFYKRTYEHYQEMNLRRKFHKWRKTALKLKMINNLLIKENYSKNQNSSKLNQINKNDKKILKYESIKKEENNNFNNKLIRQENNYYNFNNDFEPKKNGINSYNDKIEEKIEDYIKNKNIYNKENYNFHYENNENIDEYKEDFGEEFDYNKLYYKNNYI